MKNFIKNLSDGGLAEDTQAFMERALDENVNKEEMVNKQEFITKVRCWLEKHIYDDQYWTSDGDDLFIGYLLYDICKYLEEE